MPGLALGGYALRVVRAAVAENDQPPRVGACWGLLADGLRLAVLSIGYALVPVAGSLAGTLLMVMALAVGGEGGLVALIVGGTVFLVSALLAFIAAFLSPASILSLAVDGSLAAAVSPSRLRRVTLRERTS